MGEKLRAEDHEFPAWMERTVQMLGKENCKKLRESNVLVAGLGGVGSVAVENLVRSGIGSLTIIDHDKVQASNINRQLPALHSTIGQSKIDVMRGRLLDINPELKLTCIEDFLNGDLMDQVIDSRFSFVVDAIDTLMPKIRLIEKTVTMGIPLASSMGSGGKTDPTKITITDFSKTYNCRLAYVLRKKLRKRGIERGFNVVFSTEMVPKELIIEVENERNKKSQVGTVPFIPGIFGAMLASIVVNGIIEEKDAI